MLEIFLVRHGQTEWNAAGIVQGRRGSPLTPLGRAQVEAAAGALAGRGISVVYASPLERAVETAEILSRRLGAPILKADGLMEIGLGPWEGLHIEEVRRRWPGAHRAWREDAREPPLEGMESARALEARVREALETITRRHAGGGAVAAIVHGGSGSALLDVVLGIEVRSVWHLLMENGGISVVGAENEHRWLRTFNMVDHLRGIS